MRKGRVMKLLVKEPFRDAVDHVTIHQPGEILDIDDGARINDMKKRGLCEDYKDNSPEAESQGTRKKKP